MNIAGFFDRLQNPLDDLNTVKKMVESYTFGDMYLNVVKRNTEGKVTSTIDTKDEDEYFSSVFNEWKNYLNNLNLASLGGLINSAKSNRELVYIRKYLKDVPDVTTRDEVERILWTECPTNLKDIIARNDPFTAPNVYPLIYAASSFINVGVPSQPARHRLYLNVDSDCTYLLANKLREKCNELKLQYEYKFQPDGTRDDSFVVYCTDENLMLFIDILEKLRKDNVRLKNGIKKPPILTAVYNGWLGYGEEKENAKSSYNDLRAKTMVGILNEEFEKWLDVAMKNNVKSGGETMSFPEYLFRRLFSKALEGKLWYPEGMSKEQLYYGLEHDVLGYLGFKNSNEANVAVNDFVIEAELTDMFIQNVTMFPKKLIGVQSALKEGFKKKGISSNLAFCKELQEDVEDYREYTSQFHKLVSSRRMSMDGLFEKIYISLDILYNHQIDNPLYSFDKIKRKYNKDFLLLKSYFKTLPDFELHELSATSDDYVERNYYYVYSMYGALAQGNLDLYESLTNAAYSFNYYEKSYKR